MADSAVLLHETPERFFNSACWSKYLAIHFGSRATALAELSQTEQPLLSLYRQELQERPWLNTPETLRSQLLASLKNDLLTGFAEKLVSRQLIATGYAASSAERTIIPAELWDDLCPDFTNDTAKGSGLEFTRVRLSEALEPSTLPILPLDKIIEWMKQLARQGIDSRKELQREAKAQFGREFPARAFNAAYKGAFGRRRGRPPKTKAL
jgi:hypothetical protein